MRSRLLGGAIYGLTTLIGLLALLYPFAWPQRLATVNPVFLASLVGLSFAALLLEAQRETAGAKSVALLGVLVALNAVLRFAETAFPGPGGFTPIFFLILLTGYVFGGRFGFLMGVLTLLVSGLITGGVGPWLPYQMLTAGWVGLSVPLCARLIRLVNGEDGQLEVGLLVITGVLWGLLYGIITNLWFWPFAVGPADQVWEAGLGWGEAVRRYALFYAATSLAWDLLRAVGNGALLLAFGRPTLRALRRFRQRLEFTYRPVGEGSERA